MLRPYVEPIGIGAVWFLGIVLLLWLPYVIWQYRRHGSLRGRRILTQSAFVLYLACAWALVLAPFPESQAAACARHGGAIQLEPFRWVTDVQTGLARSRSTGWRAVLSNVALFVRVFNVALTVPFGVFLRRWFRRSLLVTTLAGFALSLAFELTQLTGIWGIYDCPYRTFDVDDLIANTFGAAVGWALAPAIVLLPKRSAHDDLHVTTEHAGLFRRLVAMIVDVGAWALLYVSLLFTGIFTVAVLRVTVTPRTLSMTMWLISFLCIFVLIPAATGGASPGKFLVRLSTGRAIDPRRPAALWQHLVRELLVFGPLALAPTLGNGVDWRSQAQLALVVSVPLAWWAVLGVSALLRADRRSLVDLVAGTVPVVVTPEAQAQLDAQSTSGASPK